MGFPSASRYERVERFTQRRWPPRWEAFAAMLEHVRREWEGAPRHRDPIFERDGWRCAVS